MLFDIIILLSSSSSSSSSSILILYLKIYSGDKVLSNLASDVSEHYENTTHNHRTTCVDGIIDKGPSSHNNFCLITNHNDLSKSPWIIVDLLGQKFDKVILHNRVDCCQQLINGASVSITADKDGKQILWTDSIPHTSEKQYVFHELPFTTDKNPTPISKETIKGSNNKAKSVDSTDSTKSKSDSATTSQSKVSESKQAPLESKPATETKTTTETTKTAETVPKQPITTKQTEAASVAPKTSSTETTSKTEPKQTATATPKTEPKQAVKGNIKASEFE